jgi:hypothetical protein
MASVVYGSDDSFACSRFYESTYREVIDGIAFRPQMQVPAWKEFDAAKPFLHDLATNPAPDFAKYLTNDVNKNPIAVYWSQFAQGVQNPIVDFTIPEDYRKLLFIHSLQELLTNTADQIVCNRMFLEAVDGVPAGSFYCKPYYYPAYKPKDHAIFLREVAGNLRFAAGRNTKAAGLLLENTFLMRNGLSEWFWNSAFKQDILTEFGTGLVVRTAAPEPLPVFVDVLQEAYRDDPVYTNICEGLTGFFTNQLTEVIELIALRENPDMNTNMTERAARAIAEAGRTLAVWDESLTDAISFSSLPKTIERPAKEDFSAEWARTASANIDRFLYVVRTLNTLDVVNTDCFVPAKKYLLTIALDLNRHSNAPYRDLLGKQLQAALMVP